MTTQPKFRKFTPKQRKEVANVIRDYKSRGGNMKPRFIARMLREKGVPHPNGQWDGARVGLFLKQVTIRVRSTEPQQQLTLQKEDRRQEKSDLIAVAEMVLAANLDDDKKERVLRQLLREGQ
jgi:hypothetical protein